MKKFILFLFVFIPVCTIAQSKKGGDGERWNDLSFGCYLNEEQKLNLNFEFMVYDIYPNSGIDKGVSIFTQFARTRTKIGISYVDRLHFWGLSHSFFSNHNLRLGILMSYKSPNERKNYYGVELGDNLLIFGLKFGLWFPMKSRTTALYTIEYGIGY